MLKAVGKDSKGKPLIMLGLSAKNIQLLKAGRPIYVPLAELGLEGAIAISYGETEDDLAAEWKKTFSFGEVKDER